MPPGASLEDVFEIAPNWYCLVALEAGYEAERDGCAQAFEPFIRSAPGAVWPWSLG